MCLIRSTDAFMDSLARSSCALVVIDISYQANTEFSMLSYNAITAVYL